MATRDLLFNWVALMVSGAAKKYDTGVQDTTPEPSTTPPKSADTPPVVSGEIGSPIIDPTPVEEPSIDIPVVSTGSDIGIPEETT